MKGNYRDDFVFNALSSRSGESFYDTNKLSEIEINKCYMESFFIMQQRIPMIKLNGEKLLSKKGYKDFKSEMYETYFKSFVHSGKPETLYSWILHLYNSFHWQGGTVKALTESLDHYGRQVSMPFWDTKIQSFLSSMPESWGRGLDFNQTKYPLKWMLCNKVDYPLHLQTGPHSYLYDSDPNWNVISELLYNSEISNLYKEILKEHKYHNLLNETYFNLDYLNDLVDDYCNNIQVAGQEKNDLFVLAMLSFVGWY
jgi:hypothetical protein